jgi:nickel transport protein
MFHFWVWGFRQLSGTNVEDPKSLREVRMRLQILIIWCSCLILLISFFVTLPVEAHKLTVFAWVEGDQVKVEGKLPKGRHPKHGTVLVYDGKDRLLLKKAIEPDGTTEFPLENWEEGLKIIMDIGEGHESYWILTPYDISEQLKQVRPEQ